MADDHFNIFEIYARYCDIVSINDHANSKEMLNMLSKSLTSRGQIRDAIFNDLSRLMSCLHFSVDSRQFNCFYDFVFFACRENGQKNITVSRAISAWRLVLTGRFRLLNQWCNFIQEHQKHNISEDTWRQLLAFSRCVNEDLEGYDPKGAWPVVIDDFAEYTYRLRQSSSSTEELCCNRGDMEAPGITNTFSGLNLLPGSKRKLVADTDGQCDASPMCYENSAIPDHMMEPKRAKHMHSVLDIYVIDGTVDAKADVNRQQTSPSACAVEDCLSKGFEGHLSIGHRSQFDGKSRLSYA